MQRKCPKFRVKPPAGAKHPEAENRKTHPENISSVVKGFLLLVVNFTTVTTGTVTTVTITTVTTVTISTVTITIVTNSKEAKLISSTQFKKITS